MAEHDNYGVEFLKATTRIKATCRGSYHTLCLCTSLSLFPSTSLSFDFFSHVFVSFSFFMVISLHSLSPYLNSSHYYFLCFYVPFFLHYFFLSSLYTLLLVTSMNLY
jgi:hypothetical protein